jgi:hypothetical protein
VWGGSAEAVEMIEFSAENRLVKLESRKDSKGLWYIGRVEKTIELRPPMRDGGAPDGMSLLEPADAGVAAAPGEKKKETTNFVSVEQGKKLAESLAPLMALRKLGKVEDARAEEFGLHKPEGTLKVTLSGRTRTLVIGGATPGGSDRYAKDDSGEVFAISGNVAQNVLFAESRLIERNLHGFEADEVKQVKIEKGTLSRELVRVEDKKDGWADSATPTTLDETAGNWMSKLDRLRIMNFVETPAHPLGQDAATVRVGYFGKGGRHLGYVELFKVPGPQGKPMFLAKTEHTRWYAEVLTSAAEQVEQDLASVVKAP